MWGQKARLASLGVQKTVSELRAITSSSKSTKRKCKKFDHSSTPLRRSNRLKEKVDHSSTHLRRSNRLNGKKCSSEPSFKGLSTYIKMCLRSHFHVWMFSVLHTHTHWRAGFQGQVGLLSLVLLKMMVRRGLQMRH